MTDNVTPFRRRTTPEPLPLAELTGYPVAFFYKPLEPGPLTGSPVFMCGSGCEVVEPDVIDERGVLLYGGKPRELPSSVQGMLF